jgi:hypothetical protein
MKLLKSILAGSLLLAFACAANAQTIVRVTGSTAFRGQTHQAKLAAFDASPAATYGYTGASFTGAGQAIFTGKVGGADVIVKTFWSGSEAGIQAVAGSKSLSNFLPNATAQSTTGTSGASTGTEAGTPDIAMSDTFQASSVYKGNYRGTNYVTLLPADARVGVVPFQYTVSKGTPATVTNMSAQFARNVFNTGFAPAALLSGVVADETSILYATGRNPDSGTRLTCLAEPGLGAQAAVQQYQPLKGGAIATTSGGTLDAATFTTLWPGGTVNGNPVSLGNNGYSSGGQLAGAMGNDSPDGVSFLVTYLGTSDAATAVSGGARTLSYNGVPYSVGGIQEGTYTLWGYEQLYYRPGTTGTVLATAGAIAGKIKTVTSPILLSTMNVSRDTDGGVVTQLY